MAKKNDTTFFENKLLDFVTAKDPMLEMLQWVMDKFMEIEVAHKTGAHISNGRTIREYIAGTLIIPTILGFLWIAFCWKYQNVINSFSIANNISSIFPSVVFIISGILFMSGTLDSDCKVFTEDLELVTKGALKQKKSIPYYGIFVISMFCLFISGIIRNPYGFNEYSTLIFVPLLIWSIFSCIRRYILFL